MTLRNTPFEVTPLTPAIGAKIAGIDLADPLSEETVAALKDTLHDRLVLFFADQHLTPAAHRTFAAHFGPLHIHPIYPNVPETPEILILDTDAKNLPDNDNWHTDVTFIQTPPLGAALYAKKIPPAGGDTLWLSTIAAYDALSAPFKKLLDGLTAVHEFEKSFPRDRFATGEALKKWEEARGEKSTGRPPGRAHPSGERQEGAVRQFGLHHPDQRAVEERERTPYSPISSSTSPGPSSRSATTGARTTWRCGTTA